MYGILASTASPQWWAVGWIVSVLLLVLGYVIAMAYYDGGQEEAPPDTESNQTGGRSA